jgi:tetratricopeptide (TPR) repeat protein
MRIAAGVFVIVSALALAAPASAQKPEYAELVAMYRRGAFDEAIETLLKTPLSPARQREIRAWIKQRERDKQTDDLAAALMLHSEAVFVVHTEAPGIGGTLSRGRAHQDAVSVLHQSLERVAPRTNFTRTWYLMWESFRQGFAIPEIDKDTDFLPDALEAFPDDAYVLLAIGARYESYWWLSLDNALRDVSAAESVDSRQLRSAEEWLRKSVASDPSLPEARLRLARVLTVRGKVDEAQAQLADIRTDDPNYRYLAELFLGQARERAGDPQGAAAAYARAVALVEWPQAARVAAAHVAFGSGRRAEAAAVLTQSLAARPDAVDPWSAYVRGQWWYLQNRIRRARSLVLAVPPAAAR